MSLIILWAAAIGCMHLTTEIFRRFWNRGLSVKVSFAEKQIEEGQSVILREQVENRKILPLLTLNIKFKLDRDITYVNMENTRRTDNQYRNDCISVMPYQRVTRSLEVIGTKRGFYQVKKVDITAADFFFRKIFMDQTDSHGALYVYPKHSCMVGLKEVFNLMYGAYQTNRLMQEDPFALKGIRDYTPIDPMHKVNWKSTARTGSLKVNQYFNTTSQQLTIFLNVKQDRMLQCEDLIEESIRIARNFIEGFLQKGVPVILISNGRDQLTGNEVFQQEGAGAAHTASYLRQLARIDIHGKVRPMEELLWEQIKQRQGMEYGVSLLISAEQSEELVQAYGAYAGESGNASWLIPIHAAMKRYITETAGSRGHDGSHIRMEYLVME